MYSGESCKSWFLFAILQLFYVIGIQDVRDEQTSPGDVSGAPKQEGDEANLGREKDIKGERERAQKLEDR